MRLEESNSRESLNGLIMVPYFMFAVNPIERCPLFKEDYLKKKGLLEIEVLLYGGNRIKHKHNPRTIFYRV